MKRDAAILAIYVIYAFKGIAPLGVLIERHIESHCI